MYSLQALNSNDRFSHRKADDELDYHPRDLYETLRDTVAWLKLSAGAVRHTKKRLRSKIVIEF